MAAGPDPDSEQLTNRGDVLADISLPCSGARVRARVSTRVYKHVRAGHCQLRAVPCRPAAVFFPSDSARAFQNWVDARNSATLDEPTAYFVTMASGLGTSRVVARGKLLEIATRWREEDGHVLSKPKIVLHKKILLNSLINSLHKNISEFVLAENNMTCVKFKRTNSSYSLFSINQMKIFQSEMV